MKKLLLIAAVLISASSFAQRTIDWSTDSIAKPDSLKLTSSGTPLDIEFYMKNLGTDSVFAGDTVVWQFSTTNTNPRIYFPSANSFRFTVTTKTYAPGDTMKVSISGLSLPGTFQTSFNLNIQIVSFVVKAGSITPEGTTTAANNVKTKTLVWYNQQGWPVGVAEAASNVSASVYPNPVSDKLYFETNTNTAKTITVMDIAGKVVATLSTTEEKAELDVTTFNKGLYFYDIKTATGEVLKSGKFNVQ